MILNDDINDIKYNVSFPPRMDIQTRLGPGAQISKFSPSLYLSMSLSISHLYLISGSLGLLASFSPIGEFFLHGVSELASGGSSLNAQKRREHFLDGVDRKPPGKSQVGPAWPRTQPWTNH